MLAPRVDPVMVVEAADVAEDVARRRGRSFSWRCRTWLCQGWRCRGWRKSFKRGIAGRETTVQPRNVSSFSYDWKALTCPSSNCCYFGPLGWRIRVWCCCCFCFHCFVCSCTIRSHCHCRYCCIWGCCCCGGICCCVCCCGRSWYCCCRCTVQGWSESGYSSSPTIPPRLSKLALNVGERNDVYSESKQPLH